MASVKMEGQERRLETGREDKLILHTPHLDVNVNTRYTVNSKDVYYASIIEFSFVINKLLNYYFKNRKKLDESD